KTFRIASTDVVMQDYGDSRGKIIISNDDFGYNLSYYWGSMGNGTDLTKFLLRAADDYLIGKLGQTHDQGDIDIKRTMASVRKFVKEETDWRWYYSPEMDKELRDTLNEIKEYSCDDRDFVDKMH